MYTNTGRILVVDDDPDLRQAFEITLTHKGYLSDSAQDGAHALSLLEENPYDVILIDLKMPKMDGLATLSAINHNHYPSQFILMTGPGMSSQVAEAIKMGVDGVIYKPFQVDKIVQNLIRGNPVELHTSYLQSVWKRMSPVIGAPTAQAVFQKMLDKFHQEQQEEIIKVSISQDGFVLQQIERGCPSEAFDKNEALRRGLRQLLAEVYNLLSMLTGDVFEESIIQDLSNHLKTPATTLIDRVN